MSTRRNLLLGGGLFVLGGGALALRSGLLDSGRDQTFPYALTEEEWSAKLTPEQFAVLRDEVTERPFSSPLNEEKRPGLYACAGCAQQAYDAAAKFDSGTGWPSFSSPLPDAVGTRSDYSLLIPRTEVHCSNCGGHLGHIFDDGPEPTGERHCLNGLALDFQVV